MTQAAGRAATDMMGQAQQTAEEVAETLADDVRETAGKVWDGN
jgi:hypothetical protein